MLSPCPAFPPLAAARLTTTFVVGSTLTGFGVVAAAFPLLAASRPTIVFGASTLFRITALFALVFD